MARSRQSDEDGAARGVLDERRRLVAATALFAAVAVILVLGAVLETSGPDRQPPVASEEPRTPAVTRAAAAIDEPPDALSPDPYESPPAPPPPAAEAPRAAAHAPSVEQRAADDRERLVKSGGSYTVQLMVACDPGNASRVLEAARDAARVYVLPFAHDGKDCYRVCWGSYATREAAETAVDLPQGLASMFPNTRVRPVAEVTS
jgi:septal ring-binding cell division protein DamX